MYHQPSARDSRRRHGSRAHPHPVSHYRSQPGARHRRPFPPRGPHPSAADPSHHYHLGRYGVYHSGYPRKQSDEEECNSSPSSHFHYNGSRKGRKYTGDENDELLLDSADADDDVDDDVDGPHSGHSVSESLIQRMLAEAATSLTCEVLKQLPSDTGDGDFDLREFVDRVAAQTVAARARQERENHYHAAHQVRMTPVHYDRAHSHSSRRHRNPHHHHSSLSSSSTRYRGVESERSSPVKRGGTQKITGHLSFSEPWSPVCESTSELMALSTGVDRSEEEDPPAAADDDGNESVEEDIKESETSSTTGASAAMAADHHHRHRHQSTTNVDSGEEKVEDASVEDKDSQPSDSKTDEQNTSDHLQSVIASSSQRSSAITRSGGVNSSLRSSVIRVRTDSDFEVSPKKKTKKNNQSDNDNDHRHSVIASSEYHSSSPLKSVLKKKPCLTPDGGGKPTSFFSDGSLIGGSPMVSFMLNGGDPAISAFSLHHHSPVMKTPPMKKKTGDEQSESLTPLMSSLDLSLKSALKSPSTSKSGKKKRNSNKHSTSKKMMKKKRMSAKKTRVKFGNVEVLRFEQLAGPGSHGVPLEENCALYLGDLIRTEPVKSLDKYELIRKRKKRRMMKKKHDRTEDMGASSLSPDERRAMIEECHSVITDEELEAEQEELDHIRQSRLRGIGCYCLPLCRMDYRKMAASCRRLKLSDRGSKSVLQSRLKEYIEKTVRERRRKQLISERMHEVHTSDDDDDGNEDDDSGDDDESGGPDSATQTARSTSTSSSSSSSSSSSDPSTTMKVARLVCCRVCLKKECNGECELVGPILWRKKLHNLQSSPDVGPFNPTKTGVIKSECDAQTKKPHPRSLTDSPSSPAFPLGSRSPFFRGGDILASPSKSPVFTGDEGDRHFEEKMAHLEAERQRMLMRAKKKKSKLRKKKMKKEQRQKHQKQRMERMEQMIEEDPWIDDFDPMTVCCWDESSCACLRHDLECHQGPHYSEKLGAMCGCIKFDEIAVCDNPLGQYAYREPCYDEWLIREWTEFYAEKSDDDDEGEDEDDSEAEEHTHGRSKGSANYRGGSDYRKKGYHAHPKGHSSKKWTRSK